MSYGQQNNTQNIYDRLGAAQNGSLRNQNYVNQNQQMPGQQSNSYVNPQLKAALTSPLPQLYTNQYGQVVDGYGNAYPDASSAMQAQMQAQMRLTSPMPQLFTNQYGQLVDAYGNVYPDASYAMQGGAYSQMYMQGGMQPQSMMQGGMQPMMSPDGEGGLSQIDISNSTGRKEEKEPERVHHKSSRQRNVTGATGHISQKALNTINDSTVSEPVRLKEAEQKNIDIQAEIIEKDIKIEEKNEETFFVPKRPEVPQQIPRPKSPPQVSRPKVKKPSWELTPDDDGKKAKLKKSWEIRKRRRIRITVAVIVIVIAGVAAALVAKAMLPYETANLCDLFTVEYGGYNTRGTATAVLNEEAVDSLLTDLKDDYDNALIHFENPEPEDYAKFRSSLVGNLSSAEGLSNGSTIALTVSYDKELAKKLKIDVESVTVPITVNSLLRATVISNEQLFEDVAVTFSGISPNVTVAVTNNSSHPFLSSVSYEIIEPKEVYANGDQVEILATFDAQEAFEQQYVVDENATCINVYEVSSDASYVSDASDITSSIVSEAVSAGKQAFTDANEYGVRIYCEANLVPVYVNKKATFVWKDCKAISAYFKSAFDETAGELGNDFNDLDVIYECLMTQANGVNCKCYCAVRFSNFTKNSDGTIGYDFSNPSIMSASYYSARVKKNVVDSYVNTHEVTKVL